MSEELLTALAEQEAMVSQHGWIAHHVYETYEGELNGMCNVHTHGLPMKYGHLDLQIVLPIPPEQNHALLWSIVRQIEDGRVFAPEVRHKDVLQGDYEVMFRIYREHHRNVLRLLIPDPSGKLPMDDGCEPIYVRQIERLPE